MDSSANHFRALCNRLEKSVILILKYLENLFSKNTIVSFIKTKKTIKTKLIIIIIIFLQKCLTRKINLEGVAGVYWRDPDLHEVIEFLGNPNCVVKANAAAYLQHLCYMDDPVKAKTR